MKDKGTYSNHTEEQQLIVDTDKTANILYDDKLKQVVAINENGEIRIYARQRDNESEPWGEYVSVF